jgi:heme exporter protein B
MAQGSSVQAVAGPKNALPAARPRAARPPSWPRQAWLVLAKDLRIEAKTREIVVTSGFFALLVALIISITFSVSKSGAEKGAIPAAVIWVSVSFAAVLSLSRTWQREREESALTGLLVSPLSRSALFAGKALGVVAFLAAIEAVVVPVSALLFDFNLLTYGPGVAVIALVATPGIAASGTLFGAMTVRTRARDLVLASVLLPLLAPTILAAVGATRELIGGSTVAELSDYLGIMGVFDFVFFAGGLSLFGALIGD